MTASSAVPVPSKSTRPNTATNIRGKYQSPKKSLAVPEHHAKIRQKQGNHALLLQATPSQLQEHIFQTGWQHFQALQLDIVFRSVAE